MSRTETEQRNRQRIANIMRDILIFHRVDSASLAIKRLYIFHKFGCTIDYYRFMEPVTCDAGITNPRLEDLLENHWDELEELSHSNSNEPRSEMYEIALNKSNKLLAFMYRNLILHSDPPYVASLEPMYDQAIRIIHMMEYHNTMYCENNDYVVGRLYDLCEYLRVELILSEDYVEYGLVSYLIDLMNS